MSANPQQSSSMSSPLVWFLLMDSTTGEAYKGTSVSSILRSSLAVPVIDQFRDAVYLKNSSILTGITSSQLLVYKNKTAFDQCRNAAEGKEQPLDPTESIGVRGSKEDMLVVVVPSTTERAKASSALATHLNFVEFLNRGHINRPDDRVLGTIAKRYSQQLQAVLHIGRTEPCIDLYETVKALPSSFTRGVMESDMKISINGPVSLAQPHILIAGDLKNGKFLFIKLLRLPQNTTSQSILSKRDAVIAEINTCTMLSKANIPGLVKCDVVEVTVHHTDGLDVSPGLWAALKMKRYMSALNECPQLSVDWIYRGFSRIFKALQAMHALNLVHMDVKSDNVFVDEDFNWDLGDFGSARNIGARVWTFTQVLNPYAIPAMATVIPAMDFVLLCVMVAVELKKDQWKLLCGERQNVQEHLILASLNSIGDAHFKKEVVELFEHNLKSVRDHLQFANDQCILAGVV